MSANDVYADIYLNFRDKQRWFEDLFKNMTFRDYMGFVEYCFRELDCAAEAKDGAEFYRVKGLLMALARKEIEIAHFMDNLTDKQRVSTVKIAESYYELAKGFYPQASIPQLEAAWAASLDLAARFGYISGVAEVLAPHHLFREPDPPSKGSI